MICYRYKIFVIGRPVQYSWSQNGERKMKVTVISSSLRNHSNSEILAESFISGARAKGHDVELISLKGKHIEFCRGCLVCQKTGSCPVSDDAQEIIQKMKESDVLVFASPVYYYSITGQLKTLLDRANPLYDSDYRFRDIYLLLTAAEDEITTPQKAIVTLQGWIDCFEKARLKKVIFAGGVNNPAEIASSPVLKQAEKAGSQL